MEDNVKEFIQNTQALTVVDSCRDLVNGNCHGSKRPRDDEAEEHKLQRRKRSKS